MCPTESPGFEAKTTGRKELGTCVLPRPGFNRMEGARSMCPAERPGFQANHRMEGARNMCPTERPGFEANHRMEGAWNTCPTESPGFDRMEGAIGTCVLPRALGTRLKPQEGRS